MEPKPGESSSEVVNAIMTKLVNERDRLMMVLNEVKTSERALRSELQAAQNTMDSLRNENEMMRTSLFDCRDELKTAREHDEQMNTALGKLAPKGTWLCEVLENIWRAPNVEEASAIAEKASEAIKEQGFWTGPRIQAQLQAARSELAQLKASRDVSSRGENHEPNN